MTREPLDIPEEVVLEQRHVALLQQARIPRWLAVGFAVFATLAALAFTVQYLTLRPVVDDTKRITADTNTVVNETVAARDKTIADQKIVIDQAVYYVTLMARQIATLGGTPPEVLLDPARGEPPPP